MHRINTMIRIFTTFLFLPLFLTACEVPKAIDDGPDAVLYFETIGMGQYGTMRDTTEAVYRDEASFQSVRDSLTLLAPLPEIDFSQVMVGLVAIPTNSGGYVVEVKSVEKTGDEISVNYELSIPGQDCITLDALSLPFQLVIIQQSEGVVSFQRNETTYRCTN